MIKSSGTAITLGSQVVAARLLGAEEYGNYIYTLTWINVLVLFGKLGFDVTSLRFVSNYYFKQDWGRLKGFLNYSNRVVLCSATFTSSILVFSTWLLQDYLSRELINTFWIASITLPILSALQVQQQRLRALQKVVLSLLPQEVLLPLVLSIGLILAATILPEIRAFVAMLINLAATAIALCTIYLWLRQSLPKPLNKVRIIPDFGEWWHTALSMMLISSSTLILSQTGTVMIGILSSTEAAGLYAVASKLSGLLVFVLGSINLVLAPMIAKLYAQESREELHKVVSLGVKVSSLSSIVMAILLIACGRSILRLFGEEFTLSYSPLTFLVLGQLFNAISGPVGLLLNMTGHQDDVAKVFGVSAIANIVLNALLIPSYGATGAAITTLITTISWNTGMSIIVWHRLQIIPFLGLL